MNTAIVYYSKGGNTKKIAYAIGEAIGVEPIDIMTPHVLKDIELLFIGSGIYAGAPAPEMINYINNLQPKEIKGAVIFSTCQSGKENIHLLVNSLQSKGIEVFHKSFVCKGKRFIFARKHPDDNDIAKAKRFASKIVDALVERHG